MPVARRMVQAGEAAACGVADAVGDRTVAIERAKALAALAGPSFAANKKFINAKLKGELEVAFAEADRL